MNLIKQFFLISFTFISLVAMNPDNTIIISDLDDVLIEPNAFHKWNIVSSGIRQNPLNTINYIRSLSRIKRRLYDENNTKINGLTFHFLFHGMHDDNLMPYVPLIVKTMENSRCYIEGTKKIYDYLKYKKGYTIVFATNKDRISYDATAKAFGKDFTSLASKAFVAQPGNNDEVINTFSTFSQKPHLTENYKTMLRDALTIQESDNIHHAPQPKPDSEYYHHLLATLNIKKQIIFIDDLQENVSGFTNLSCKDRPIHGIHFKNPIQLLKELISLSVISPEEGAMLFKDISEHQKKQAMIKHIPACLIIALVLFIGKILIQ